MEQGKTKAQSAKSRTEFETVNSGRYFLGLC